MSSPSNPKELISQQALSEIMRTATLEVFSTMLSLPLTACESASAAGPRSGIVSLIGVAGAWAGTGCLASSGKLACRLSEEFLMTPFETVNEDVLDAVGEITNMIIGNVKQAGASTIAQNEASCVVFGMPREAIRAGAVDDILPLDQIAAMLTRMAAASLK